MVLVAALGGCAGTRLEKKAQLTAHRVETHGDGYRAGDDPGAIVDLLKRYAVENNGEVLATEVIPGPRPIGRVDVAFTPSSAGKWESTAAECWRFRFQPPEGDPYVREIGYAVIDCPEDV